MQSYDDETYGERIAGVYDEWYGGYEADSIAVLRELAQGGRALELGIGTGRVAVPLLKAGVAVEGIDASPAMIAELRGKPGGDKIPVILGDFADVGVKGQFELIYVVVNTFYALLTQDDQLRCFRNVAERLGPEGVFVIEAFVPDIARFDGRQSVRAFHVGVDEVRLDVSAIDPSSQLITGQQVTLADGGVRLYPVKLRYAWPSELDLMARLAGLRLRQRWADWQQALFTAESAKHISVYERDG